jgi:hypothetical protein
MTGQTENAFASAGNLSAGANPLLVFTGLLGNQENRACGCIESVLGEVPRGMLDRRSAAVSAAELVAQSRNDNQKRFKVRIESRIGNDDLDERLRRIRLFIAPAFAIAYHFEYALEGASTLRQAVSDIAFA